jgi:hypothetical protein
MVVKLKSSAKNVSVMLVLWTIIPAAIALISNGSTVFAQGPTNDTGFMANNTSSMANMANNTSSMANNTGSAPQVSLALTNFDYLR